MRRSVAVTVLLIFAASKAMAASIETSPRMKSPRFGSQATVLDDGTILITGGNLFRSSIRPDAEIFDPAMKTFTAVPSNMVRVRSFHTATLLDDGRVLIVGGDGFSSSPAEIFDPNAMTFTPITRDSLPARLYHTATKLNDGRRWEMGTGLRISVERPESRAFKSHSNEMTESLA